MDLEQLKYSWEQLEREPLPPIDLSSLLREAALSSGEPIRKMKRNVITQSVTLIVVYAAAYTQFHGALRLPVGILYGVTVGVFSVYYRQKYLLLRSMETVNKDEDMLTFFTRKVAQLRGFVRFYSASTFVSLPLAMIFVPTLYWFYQRPFFYILPGLHFHPGQEGWVIACWAGATLVLAIPCHYLSKAHIHRRYGRYIEWLENDLRELQEDRQ
jgi:hypothetical protein